MPVGALAGIGIALIIACGPNDHEEDDTQFREDVIWCEEAVAHLEECCGAEFDPHQVACRHFYSKDTGCNGTSIQRTDPAYTTTESRCLQHESCASIRNNNVCARALAAGAARTSSYNDQNGTPTITLFPDSGGTSSSSSSSGTSSSTSGSATSGPICP